MVRDIVLVTGSRHMTDRGHMRSVLRGLSVDPSGPELWHGGARGADTLAGEVARDFGWHVRVFEADWDRYHNSAGPIRNTQMINALRGEEARIHVIAFPLASGSAGTEDCLMKAIRAGFTTFVYPLLDKGSDR